MKALVTGGAGFIGSHVAEALYRRGADVVVLDNFSLGSRENLAWSEGASSLEVVEGDINDSDLVKQLTADCEWVFHQAAIPSVPWSVENPVDSNRDNLEASLRLMTTARDAGVRRFVFASSSAIYGDSSAPFKKESDPPLPQSPYALQKYAAERYGQLFHRLYGLETVSLRYFNVFGPRQSFDSPYSGVIAKFCTAALDGRAPEVFGDGLQSRDFVSIENVVRANLLAAERPAENVAGQVFNIAGGESLTLLQLIGELNRLTQQDLNPVFHPARAGDVRDSRADLSKARAELGYSVDVGWTDGLAQTLDEYRRLRTN